MGRVRNFKFMYVLTLEATEIFILYHVKCNIIFGEASPGHRLKCTVKKYPGVVYHTWRSSFKSSGSSRLKAG